MTAAHTLVYVKLIHLTCGQCGILHGVSENKYRVLQEGSSWFCPNGHNLSFVESEVDKVRKELTKELEKEKTRRQWAEDNAQRYSRSATAEKRRASALKGVLTKTKKRVGNGVCPCCNRSFANLRNHMNHMHPDFKESK